MVDSVFMEADFVGLVLFSIVMPVGIYAYLMWRRALSRVAVLTFAISLIVMAGVDVFLLQRLAEMTRVKASLLDHQVFTSQLSVALYLLPALFAGVGVNMISHVLTAHLSQAKRQFDRRYLSRDQRKSGALKHLGGS